RLLREQYPRRAIPRIDMELAVGFASSGGHVDEPERAGTDPSDRAPGVHHPGEQREIVGRAAPGGPAALDGRGAQVIARADRETHAVTPGALAAGRGIKPVVAGIVDRGDGRHPVLE